MNKKITTQSIWHNSALPDIFRKLRSDAKGLTSKQAAERLKIYGANSLPREKKQSSFGIFINQLKSPLVYVMIFALGVSIFLSEWPDASVIAFVIIINTIFGWWQENKASDAIGKLKKLIVYSARAIRDGRQILIDTSQLVPGDIVYLKSGNNVPADCRVIASENLQTQESLLTGESAPSTKSNKAIAPGAPLAERSNMLYMGTSVVRGTGEAIVVETVLNTEMGKIGRLLSATATERTPLQEQLAKFSRLLTIVIACLCIFVILDGLLRGYSLPEMLLTASALAVAAVPEGLLIAVTIILAVGMQKILLSKSLVRRLVAAETLGGVSIILTDKTGTLTEGKMQVARFVSTDQEFFRQKPEVMELSELEKEHNLMLKISLLCSSAQIENPDDALNELKIIGDPTESALLIAGIEAGFNKDELDKEYKKIKELPFDSEKKYMATMHSHKRDHHDHVFVKGAPEKILAFCSRTYLSGEKHPLTSAHRRQIQSKVEEMTSAGLRVIALAYKTSDKFNSLEDELSDLVFIGLIALKDPLRPEAAWAVNECRKAGIRPIMITGDHPLTAKAIFEELGFKERGRVITGAELDELSDSQLDKKLDKIDIYARVEPHHKLRLVRAWQSRGEVVAMAGDGINDAPAIKAADIGIALGSGSDVAKETADIILLDNNFKTIVETVREGRIIFDNIRKVFFYLLTGSFSEIILILGSILLGLPLPLLALQILWINLIDHGLPSFALALEREEDNVMSYPPRPRNEQILNREIKIMIFVVGIITDIILFGIFIAMHFSGIDASYARTFIFAALCLDSLLVAFSVRSLRRTIFSKRIFDNKYLLGAVAVSLVFMIFAFTPPLNHLVFKTVIFGPIEWLAVLAVALFKLSAIEAAKYFLIIRRISGYAQRRLA
ncbi:MAG: HAD-IC family P-type ATPase [Candidatus Buchananbacteria bacterium]|jgi:Ca2+-transporting ATPase